MYRLTHLARPFAIGCVSALLQSCAALPPPASFPAASNASSIERAEAAAQRGDRVQAAETFEALATSATAGDRVALRLRAARAWLNAGRSTDAARLLQLVGTATTAEQRNERALLEAEIALANGQPQQAWASIDQLPEPAGPAALTYLDARMRIAMATARPLDAVRAETRAEAVGASSAQRTDIRNKLLALLRQARERGVKLDPAASNDATIKGWLDLGAMIGSGRGASLGGGADAARWQARYPGHPAGELLSEALPPALNSGSITRIALLLPATGSGSTEARAIREGFEFALRQLRDSPAPELHFYDTSSTPAVEQLAVARAEGANFIVGPFLRADVTAAASTGNQAVPVLALNFLAGDEASAPGFYQFALSPEDEARETARRILAKGQKRGVALAPASEWGNRVLAAFAQEFRAGGGVLLAQASYDTSAPDYAAPIKQVLGVGESETRLQRLQRSTGAKYEFEPRRHADIEFVYAAAFQTSHARLLRPQLNYNFAGSLPIYMSSNSYTPDSPEVAQDLSGIEFPDMPWRLPDVSLDATRAEAAQTAGSAWRSPYFAFGYDALQLALAIAVNRRDSSRVQVAGLSGQLHVGSNGRVQREQQWARIKDGTATLADSR
jgi:outer membrane PBP1 activator LpoA protein